MERNAACACGQLRIRCEGETTKVSVCHCTECQRRTGSPFGVAAFFESSQVTPFGRALQYARPSDKGSMVTFHFCPECGSAVYWSTARLPNLIAVALGAFADPAFPAPTQEVYAHLRHSWVALRI